MQAYQTSRFLRESAVVVGMIDPAIFDWEPKECIEPVRQTALFAILF